MDEIADKGASRLFLKRPSLHDQFALFARRKKCQMQLGMIGLGLMGSNMVRRLLKNCHAFVVHDVQASATAELVRDVAKNATSLQEMVSRLARPRAIWLMAPAAVVDQALGDLVPLLDVGDVIVDGGSSHCRDDMRRGTQLQARGIHCLDVGTSGSVAGLERGYCLMIGGEGGAVAHLQPILLSLAPGVGAAARTPGRSDLTVSAEEGFLHCGPNGAGHFVEMVHNSSQYGVMAAYAEGLNILRNANMGKQDQQHQTELDAETTLLRDPEPYRFDMNMPDIAEVWRRGSVLGSWLLDLTASALLEDPGLTQYGGRATDSGEGRCTIQVAIDEGVATPVLSAALNSRFASRGNADFSIPILSPMRHEFGGHAEKAPP